MDNARSSDIPVNTRSLISVLKKKKDKLRRQLTDKDTQFEETNVSEFVQKGQKCFKESLNENLMGIQDNSSQYEEIAIHSSEGHKRQNLSLSIRSRLMEKLKTVKDMAKEEIYNKEKSYPLTTFQYKENKDQEMLESSILEKVETKIGKHHKLNIEIPSIDDQIDFCLKNFDEYDKRKKGDQTVDCVNALDSWMPYILMGPSDYKQTEISHYFHPSSLPEGKKFLNDSNTRVIEEEGFFMAPKAQIDKYNLNKVENRLIIETGESQKESEFNFLRLEKWFKEDGRVICLIDVLKESSRHLFGNEETLFFVSPFVKPEFQDNQTIGDDNYHKLDMDINNINFTHHHLFSKEHVLASILRQQHQLYALKKEAHISHYLYEKILILKSTIVQLQENFKLNDQSAENELKKLKNEMRIVRKQRDEEFILQRNLLKNILVLWKDIKLVRKNSKCTNTGIRLTVIKEDVDFDDDFKKWEADAKDEFDWLKEDVVNKFNADNSFYIDELNCWKDQKLKKKLAKRRMAIHKKRFNNIEFVESEVVIKDNETLAEKMMRKPIKPIMISDEDLKEEVLKKFEMIKRKPGEPKIVLHLSGNGAITPTQDCPMEEKLRRNEVERCKLHIKILYNGKVIGKTEKRHLEQDFTVRIGEILNIKVTHWPESIAFEIYEGEQLLATAYSIIPEINFPQGIPLKHDFGSCIKRKYSHAAVGSGGSLIGQDIKSNRNICLNTSGVLIGCVTWSSNNLLSIKEPSVTRSKLLRDAISSIGLHGLDNIKKLHDWLETCHIDPNDSSNAAILQLIKPVGISGFHSQDYSGLFSHFRLEHLLDEFSLACKEEISNSQRFQMIEMREAQIPGFKHLKVPLYDREINESVFSQVQKSVNVHEKLPKGDEIDAYKKKTSKFLQEMNSSIIKRHLLISTRKTYSEVINENNIPNISFVLKSLNSIFEPKRPLKPARTLNKKIVPKYLESEIRLLINVIRAIGVPTRTSINVDRKSIYPNNDSTANSLYEASLNKWDVISSFFNNYEQLDEYKNTQTVKMNDQKLVCPFVEVSFQQNVISTSVSAGSQPIWNEELSFTFKPPNNDLTASSLHSCDDFIYFNIYDHFAPNDVGGKIISRKIEKKWLGFLKIPFSTIYKNDKIDGTFRIQKPPLLLGYARQRLNPDFMEMTYDDNLYLSLLITLDSKIPHSPLIAEEFYMMEDENISMRCEHWINGLKKQFPHRQFLTTVMTFHGTYVLVTRYLKSIQPPPKLLEGLFDEDAKQQMLAQYVSLIPNVSDIPFSDFCNIWATSSEFLKLLQGSEMEHAVLLANYFLNLGIQAWIIIGTALPEGQTAYVLAKSNSSGYYLWKATTGEKFSCLDNFCSLKDIGCVIGQNNIWGNIQSSDRPIQLSFNFDDSSKWKPLFTTKIPYPNLSSVQPDSLIYVDIDEGKIKNLQERIESDIRKSISIWRKKFITRWNRYCIQIFRKFLIKIKSHGKELNDLHEKELENDLSSYSVCGFPLNIPYLGNKEILEIIHSTRIYDIESNDVEFAVAVHIDPFPGYVLSVWIYVASLTKIH